MKVASLIDLTLVLGLINLIGLLVVIILPEWRVSSVAASDRSFRGVRHKEGLWLRCTAHIDEFFQCDMYDTDGVIGIDAYLTSFRALMIISMIFSVVGVVCSALGMRCATVLKEDTKQKRWVIIAGGASHIFAGSLTAICVSWYAGEVVYEFYSPMYQTTKMKYTLGACLYIGWISMVLSFVCGFIMTCCICCNKKDNNKYEYPPESQISRHLKSDFIETKNVYDDESPEPGFDSRSRKNSSHSRRGSRPYDGYNQTSRRHTLADVYNPPRRGSKYADYEYPSRRGSKVPETGHHSRRGSKHHDPENHPSSRRGSKYVDTGRRNSRKISKNEDDPLFLSSKTEGSPKTGRCDSVIHEDENGFV